MQNKRNNFSRDEVYALLIRMWSAGMVYLFVGFGTSTGQAAGGTYFIPLLFFLTVGISALSIIIVNPVIKLMLKTRLDARSYLQIPLWLKIARNLVFFITTAIIVLIISYTYAFINILINNFRQTQNMVYIPVEPLGFALLYGFFYFVIDYVSWRITCYFYTKKEKI